MKQARSWIVAPTDEGQSAESCETAAWRQDEQIDVGRSERHWYRAEREVDGEVKFE